MKRQLLIIRREKNAVLTGKQFLHWKSFSDIAEIPANCDLRTKNFYFIFTDSNAKHEHFANIHMSSLNDQ